MKLPFSGSVKPFLKAFIITGLIIMLFAGLAMADTGTKEVAGYMGDTALQFNLNGDNIELKVFDSTYEIKSPAFIKNVGDSIDHFSNFTKGIMGILKFLKGVDM